MALAALLALGADRDPVILKSPGNPLVSFRFVIHTGSAFDPPGKEGLAALTALMLSQGGTEELSLTEVMEALYPMAADFSSQPGKDVTTFIGRAHRDHLEAYYAVFRERIQKPRFDAEDFERNKNDLLNYLTKSLPSADDEELGKKSLEWELYRRTPLWPPGAGNRSPAVESLTLDDVKAFYREYYTSENLQIGMAGDLPEGIRRARRRGLPEGSAFEENRDDHASESGAREGTRRDGGRKADGGGDGHQSRLPLEITRSDDDFYPLLVANTYLGDHRTFNGVLMNELRAKRGLNYGDYSYVEAFQQDGGQHVRPPERSAAAAGASASGFGRSRRRTPISRSGERSSICAGSSIAG